MTTKGEGSGPQEICLIEFIKKRADYLASIAESYGMAYEIDEIGKEVVISFNAQKLEGIIDNLLSNAAKHSVVGGNVKIRVFSKSGSAAFEVQNRFRRIENFPEIFEAFYQERSGVLRLGLGLYICREYAKSMGCDIDY